MPSRLQACVIAARLVPLAYLGMREARLIRNMVMANLMGAIWICSRADLWVAASAAAVATKPIMARRPLILCSQQPEVNLSHRTDMGLDALAAASTARAVMARCLLVLCRRGQGQEGAGQGSIAEEPWELPQGTTCVCTHTVRVASKAVPHFEDLIEDVAQLLSVTGYARPWALLGACKRCYRCPAAVPVFAGKAAKAMLTVWCLTSGAGPVKAITSWKVSVSADMSSLPTVGEPIASFMGSGSCAALHCILLRLMCTRCCGLHAASLALRCWLCSLPSWLACRGHGTTWLQTYKMLTNSCSPGLQCVQGSSCAWCVSTKGSVTRLSLAVNRPCKCNVRLTWQLHVACMIVLVWQESRSVR